MKNLKKSIYVGVTTTSLFALTGCVFPNTTAVAVMDDPVAHQMQILGRVSARGGMINQDIHHAYYRAIEDEVVLQNKRGEHAINPYKPAYYQKHVKEIRAKENACTNALYDLKRSQLYAMRSTYLAKYVIRSDDLTAALRRARDLVQVNTPNNTQNYQNCISVLMYASSPEVIDRSLSLAAEGRVPVLKHYTQRVWHKAAVESIAESSPLTLGYIDSEIDDLPAYRQRLTVLFDPFAYEGVR